MIRTQTILDSFFRLAVPLAPSPAPTSVPNRFPLGRETLTAKWVRENWGKVEPEIRNILIRTFPKSHAMGVVDEHLQGFVCRLLSRDDLAPHIRGGHRVLTSVLCAWAKQYVSSEIRTWGTDGACRSSRQARTPANLRALESKDVSHKSFRSSPETVKRVVVVEDDGDTSTDFVSPDLSPEERVNIQRTLDLYESLIRKHLTETHVCAFKLALEGRTQEEISDSIGKASVSTIMDDVREVLQDFR